MMMIYRYTDKRTNKDPKIHSKDWTRMGRIAIVLLVLAPLVTLTTGPHVSCLNEELQTQIVQALQNLNGLIQTKPPTPVLCPGPGIGVLGKCLFFSKTTLSFDKAKQNCEALNWTMFGFDQAVIEELKEKSNETEKYFCGYWIGVRRERDGLPFTSISGNDVVVELSNTLWWTSGGFPSHTTGDDCVWVSKFWSLIGNHPCDDQRLFVCEIPV